MKNLMITAAIACLFVTSAQATGRPKPTPSQEQGQGQGQFQGQMQGQGQGQTQSSRMSSTVSVEGGVSASIGAASCANGVSAGAPGLGAVGVSLTSRKCNIRAEAQVIEDLGGNGMAHMCLIARVARSQPELCGGGTMNNPAITDQSYNSGKYNRAPVAREYSFCGDNLFGTFVFRVVPGGDQVIAQSQCLAARKAGLQ